MYTKRTFQISLFDSFAQPEIGQELATMSAWLDTHLEVLDGVAKDLRVTSAKATERHGMTAESVLRCASLKQYRQLSYEELALHRLDSASFQAFARLPMEFIPKKSALQWNISAITVATWGAINRRLLRQAQKTRAETGKMMRVDAGRDPNS